MDTYRCGFVKRGWPEDIPREYYAGDSYSVKFGYVTSSIWHLAVHAPWKKERSNLSNMLQSIYISDWYTVSFVWYIH